MSHRKIIENYFCDINNIVDTLNKLVNAYRLLIGGAHELNSIGLARKGDIKDSLDRVNKLGDVIDGLIDVLDETDESYLEYCRVKASYMKSQIQMQYIETEIDEDLKLKN